MGGVVVRFQEEAWNAVIDLANGKDPAKVAAKCRRLLNDVADFSGQPCPYPDEPRL